VLLSSKNRFAAGKHYDIKVGSSLAFCYSVNSRDIMPVGVDTNYVLCPQNAKFQKEPQLVAALQKIRMTTAPGKTPATLATPWP
jgi:hypothetical protein